MDIKKLLVILFILNILIVSCSSTRYNITNTNSITVNQSIFQNDTTIIFFKNNFYSSKKSKYISIVKKQKNTYAIKGKLKREKQNFKLKNSAKNKIQTNFNINISNFNTLNNDSLNSMKCGKTNISISDGDEYFCIIILNPKKIYSKMSYMTLTYQNICPTTDRKYFIDFVNKIESINKTKILIE